MQIKLEIHWGLLVELFVSVASSYCWNQRRNLVSTNKSNWEFIGRKKKLSTKLMGVCSGKVFTAPVCWGWGE